MGFIIAIDGPAASGKGTLARRLAKELGYQYLDTGKLYRLVAHRVLQSGGKPDDEAACVKAAQSLNSQDLTDPALMADEVGQAASVASTLPGVRAALLETQKNFARNASPGAVLDGRDIGTVIAPGANVKFFIVASVETRAKRRFKELKSLGKNVTYDAVLEDMRARDARDTGRAIAPLMPAPDAHVMDTSTLSADEVFQSALRIVRNVIM